MTSLNAQNALYKQEQRDMKKKHKQLRELRKKNGNSSVYGKCGSPKSHNATDYVIYDSEESNEEYYVS